MKDKPKKVGILLASPALILLTANASIGTALLLVALLLAASALISSSEVAFFSLTPNDIDQIKQENTATNQRILNLRTRPRILLATILICNNFINIAIVIVSDYILRYTLTKGISDAWAEKLVELCPLPLYSPSLSSFIHFSITIIGVTFLLVLFGEVAPKIYAKFNNLSLAKFMARPLTALQTFLTPLSQLLVKGTNVIESRLAQKAQESNITSRADIDHAIELAVSSNEENAEQEIDILKSIVKFGDVSAKQIMRSRVDVVAIDFRTSFKNLLKVVRKSGYSRIPVYDDDFDNLTGILYVKDLLPHLHENDQFEWQPLIRTNVFYVPEAKKINDLLKEFQAQRLHMAIVVDEYGGSSGIVTLEDIMEEVIGDIKDEFDDDTEVQYRKIDDYNYLFEGKTLLNDACRVLGIDTSTFDDIKGDADSLAGLLLEIAGDIPKAGTEISYNKYKFKAVAANKRRIEQIHVTIPKN